MKSSSVKLFHCFLFLAYLCGKSVSLCPPSGLPLSQLNFSAQNAAISSLISKGYLDDRSGCNNSCSDANTRIDCKYSDIDGTFSVVSWIWTRGNNLYKLPNQVSIPPEIQDFAPSLTSFIWYLRI
jgi:hypothetical protein